MSVYSISAFLSASCPHRCLAVARYAFASDAANLLETNIASDAANLLETNTNLS